MVSRWIAGLIVVLMSGSSALAAEPLKGVRRVVFLGDSITYAGQYIEYVETILRLRDHTLSTEFIDMGLPSETVSGLSEPGHAGGSFPRPDLHERLDRVLAQARPDLVVVCYGMNDGIYHPFSEARFAAYQAGIQFVRDHAMASGAKVVHLTPPVFDPHPIKGKTLPAGLAEYRQPFEGYDDVLARYSDWLLAQRAKGWDVVDIHGPMKAFIEQARAHDPKFHLAGDGVHIDARGHWLIARALLKHWGVPAAELDPYPTAEAAIGKHRHGPAVLKLVEARQRLLKDAWLSATGHKRPGMKRGASLAEAERTAATDDAKIRAILRP